MRISMRISTGGAGAHASLPNLPGDGDKFLNADGNLNRQRAVDWYSCHDWARLDNDDDADVIAIVTEFIDRLQLSFKAHADAHSDEIIPVTDAPHKKDAAERAMSRGRYAVVALDVRRTRSGFRIRIGWANPRNAVGDTDNCAATFARAWAAVAYAMCEDWRKTDPRVTFLLTDGDNCDGMFASVAEEMRAGETRAAHEHCERRVNGYCSPCKFDCPYYDSGKCFWR